VSGAVPPELLAILACPVCKGPLSDTGAALRCEKCRRDYPVKDGIPDLVP
jgi:uncharacterized protein YbaR (Trm112 family)